MTHLSLSRSGVRRSDGARPAGCQASENAVVHTLRTVEARYASVRQALVDIAAGRAVVVTDDDSCQHEADLIFAADLATPELMAFMVRHCSGFVCVAMSGEECDRRGMVPMSPAGGDASRTAYQVTVDAAYGVTTGISARDRAWTARLLADPATDASAFTRPGHTVPLRARPRGVLERAGCTEAAVDLCRLAGRSDAGVMCELVSDDPGGEMLRGPDVAAFAARYGLAVVSVADLIAYRRRYDLPLESSVPVCIPTPFGPFTTVGYRTGVGDHSAEHLVLVPGDRRSLSEFRNRADVQISVHTECVIGDALGSVACGCANQLQASLQRIAARDDAVLIYLRKSSVHRLVPPCHEPGGDLPRPPAWTHDLNTAAAIIDDLGICASEIVTLPEELQCPLDARLASVGGQLRPTGAAFDGASTSLRRSS